MGLILKGIGSLFLFSLFSFLATWYTIIQLLFGKNKNNELKEGIRELNSKAARKLNALSVFVKLENGIHLHAVEAGDRKNKLILLLHGFPDTWHCWKGVIPTLVKKGYFVVAPDMRGYNMSDKPKAVSDYDLPALSNDIELLIKHYKKEKAVVVGHDWGGVVSWYLAQHRPEVIEKLIIMNAPHPKAYAEVTKKDFKQVLNGWYIAFFLIPKIPYYFVNYEPRKAVKAFIQTRNENAFKEEDYDLLAAAYVYDESFSYMINYYKAVFLTKISALWRSKRNANKKERAPPVEGEEKEKRERERQIQVPTLVLWGEEDHALVPELALVSKWVKDVKITYIPNCSHWVPHEVPDVISKEVLQFIS